MFPNQHKVGDVVKHNDGRVVKIVDGSYYGTHGVSNFFSWAEVLEDGTLSDNIEHGYGKELTFEYMSD